MRRVDCPGAVGVHDPILLVHFRVLREKVDDVLSSPGDRCVKVFQFLLGTFRQRHL
jgi:hypothetical protein